MYKRKMIQSTLKVFANDSEVLAAINETRNRANQKYLAMYSSLMGGVVTNPALMVLPLDDHMVHRGHGVFESCYVHNRKIFNLRKHIQRLFRSATHAKISPPMTEDETERLVVEFARLVTVNDFGLKVYVSAGGGNFSIAPEAGRSQLYMVAIEGAYETSKETGVKEYIVDPIPPSVLVNVKSTNYLLNALAALQSTEKGGYTGIQADKEGYLLEAPVANIAIVSKKGDFIVPPFTRTLAGTTVTKVMRFLDEDLVGRSLVNSVSHGDIHRNDAYESQELMIIGGDKCTPVLSLDDEQIGNGQRGPVAMALQKFLYSEFVKGDTIDLDGHKGSHDSIMDAQE